MEKLDIDTILAEIKSNFDYEGYATNYSANSNALVVFDGQETFLIRIEAINNVTHKVTQLP